MLSIYKLAPVGVEFAKNFAKDGYDLVLVARRLDRLNSLAEELREKYKVKRQK